MAYEMLKGQYNYSITKLYPSFITDTHEQEKIFNELLSTFDEKKVWNKFYEYYQLPTFYLRSK